MLYNVASEIPIADTAKVEFFENLKPFVKKEKIRPSMNARKGSSKKLTV